MIKERIMVEKKGRSTQRKSPTAKAKTIKNTTILKVDILSSEIPLFLLCFILLLENTSPGPMPQWDNLIVSTMFSDITKPAKLPDFVPGGTKEDAIVKCNQKKTKTFCLGRQFEKTAHPGGHRHKTSGCRTHNHKKDLTRFSIWFIHILKMIESLAETIFRL
jgi:hypothetical protein